MILKTVTVLVPTFFYCYRPFSPCQSDIKRTLRLASRWSKTVSFRWFRTPPTRAINADGEQRVSENRGAWFPIGRCLFHAACLSIENLHRIKSTEFFDEFFVL